MEFNESFQNYLESVRTGTLEIYLIENLLICLKNLKENEDYEKIKIELSTKDFDAMVSRMHEYTQKLASDNSVTLKKMDNKSLNKFGTIINLEGYLETQKTIFETAS